MAEVIQLQLEGMLPELEDLKLRKLFSEEEINSIIKKRTQFEYKLKRRQPHIKDFLLYIEFEIQLDQLRQTRKKRTQPSAKTSLSDYSIQRRIFNLFERALLKYKMNISLWLSYIEYCKSSNSTKLISKIFSRVLQFHPRNPTVWILASQFEFKNNLNMSAARALMQRSIRLDPQNPQLWLEYFRIEIQYIEKIRIRRELITKGTQVNEEVVETDDVIALPDINENELKHKEPISLSEDVIKSLDNDSEFMKGLLPKIIFNNAIKAIPNDIDLRSDFLEILHPFPHLQPVTEAIYESIEKDFEDSPEAIDITIRKDIDHLQQTSENFGTKLKSCLQQYSDYFGLKPSKKIFECYCKFLNNQLLICKTDKLKSFFLLKLNQLFKLLKESDDFEFFNDFTFDYYLNYSVEILKDPKQALELSVKASELYPTNLTFWLTRLELVDDEDNDEKLKLLELALKSNSLEEELWDKYWEIKLKQIESSTDINAVEDLFQNCYSKTYKIKTKSPEDQRTLNNIQFKLFQNLMNYIVDSNSKSYIELIRSLCQKLSKKIIFNNQHYQYWISLELGAYQDETLKNEKDKREGFLWHHENKVNKQVKAWIQKITHLYELAIKNLTEGQDPIDLWYDYLTFLSDMTQHALSAQVLNRAKNQLITADYNQLQNLYKEYLIQNQNSKEFNNFDNEVVISH